MSILSNQVEAVERERDELAHKLRYAAPGNAILITREGFERAATIYTQPPYRYGGAREFPPFWTEYRHRAREELLRTVCSHHTIPATPTAHIEVTFRNTGKQDTFGRVIFEEQ